MRLASLFSGGKDSAFATYVVEQMGHDIPYLVTVDPGEDSHMFHVPNLSLVPLMAESMGKECVMARSDGTPGGDTEAMVSALSGLDVDGVVNGAILSGYQWERVNAVCGDLGLMVFSPLWRKSQETVYREILDSGIDAIVVATAAEGLGRGWLGRKLDAEAGRELAELRETRGISVTGEGGEYESLTLDSPLFSRPLVVESYEIRGGRRWGAMEVTSATLGDRKSQA
ncbi:MAG: diphthine--ammonia ligase [Thermoplasmatales archaeon]|nr:diphthine--ammonia ligase [Thermoplasmatales archaeon]